MTTYYVDWINGNDSNDGLTIKHSFKTIQQFTGNARTAGDICYVRAGQHHHYGADITFTSDGSKNNLISLIGCQGGDNPSGDDDPWGDGIDTKTIIDFDGGDFQAEGGGINYWIIKNLEFIGSTDNDGAFYVSYVSFTKFENCVFRGNNPTGLKPNAANIFMRNCEFYDNTTQSISGSSSYIYVENCIFNGGTGGTNYGYYLNYGGYSFFKDCTFGLTTSHGVNDIRIYGTGLIFLKNCKLDNPATFSINSFHAALSVEDYQQTYGDHRLLTGAGNVIKENYERNGRSISAAKMDPSAFCGLYNPLSLTYFYKTTGNFRVWINNTNPSLVPGEDPSAGFVTTTVYMKAADWTTDLPDEEELYIEVSFLDSVTGATRSTRASTEKVTNNWTAFNVNCSPMQDGFIYITVLLKKSDATGVIYVDIEPEIRNYLKEK